MDQQLTTSRVYSERYVAFIDILGFSNHVRLSETQPVEAEKLVAIMNRIDETLRDEKLQIAHDTYGVDFRSQSFSDCTVMSEAATPKGLHYLLFRATQFALDLLANGFLMRGAIAKGPLHHSAKAVFGPAFLRAYDLEQTIAKYPRIIVDRDTHRDFERNRPSGGLYDQYNIDLRLAEDGPVYVDIFSVFRIVAQHNERVSVTAKSCHTNIQSKLDEAIYNPAHYEKLHWLTLYWNGLKTQPTVVFPIAREYQRRQSPTGQGE